MAMERFLTMLVFCEAPIDGYSMSVMTTGSVSKLVSGGTSKPASHKVDDEEKKQGYSEGSTLQRHAWFQLAFDGLNCFDTVMMH
ncbi:hypothetical protein CFC21_095676 [Triticum aestivum]|uniref:Uncharacterized protein n=2 Tax=Triticum aestivum TaxID=4565 RepID=A0A9R1MXU3_WHEAT|nr:uncharacterized protein LOC123150353 [Triticum aestivum]KAF7093251.1 hypothetical protein CFC21_095674 [Triticum aestivum]KAF7093252.1 hypothetical protein CFC21_095675 [Triticum aestivum]KAF7093253.1 hypothetical protein CFC21_095676 [Triticum aestivum]